MREFVQRPTCRGIKSAYLGGFCAISEAAIPLAAVDLVEQFSKHEFHVGVVLYQRLDELKEGSSAKMGKNFGIQTVPVVLGKRRQAFV